MQAFCNFNIIFKRRSNTAVVSDIVAVLEHHEMVGILVKAYLAVADPDLYIRGRGAGHPDPEIRGGGRS